MTSEFPLETGSRISCRFAFMESVKMKRSVKNRLFYNEFRPEALVILLFLRRLASGRLNDFDARLS